MSLRRGWILFLLFLVGFGPVRAGRPGAWRCERIPASSQLDLSELRWLVVPGASSDLLLEAVQEVSELLAERCGAAVVVAGTGGKPKQAIILQLRSSRFLNQPGGCFSIRRERSRLYIRASDEAGLMNGLYSFCSEVLGARWYWDGSLGFEWVGEAPARYGKRLWLEQPAFVHRQLHPANGDYGRRNRLNRVYRFNHNLARVFSAELFAETPEAFATIRGAQREPRGSGARDPQPNFASERAVEIAARAVIAHFEREPESASFSLSINDNVLFDDTAATENAVSPLRYFRRRPDYTDMVFGFVNEVAVKVFDEAGLWETSAGQPRYLTALAYYWTEPSPQIEVHPRVMPVLTSDRAQWHSSEYREEDKQLIERWAASGAERVATWDYYFGSPYPYPRQLNQWIGESIPFLEAQGVDVFFSQLPALWGLDGAKSWLTAELLWDPSQEVEALLEEFYLQFFGEASGPMRSFYELAEAYRNENEGAPDWIKFYKDEAGIQLFDTSTLREMRALLDEAAVLVSFDEKRSQRVQVVSEAFQLTERYAAMHEARLTLIEGCLKAFSQTRVGGPLLEDGLHAYEVAKKAHDAWSQYLLDSEIHRMIKAFLKIKQTDPMPMVVAAVDLADGLDLGLLKPVFNNVDLRNGPMPPMPRDFLGPALPEISGWYFDFRASEFLKVEAARSVRLNERGLRVSGADVFSVFRDAPVKERFQYYLDVDLAWSVSPDNRTQVRVNWYDASGATVRVDLPLQLPIGESADVQRILLAFEAPESAVRARVHFTSSRQYAGDFLELRRIDLREAGAPLL
ncbi:MAG: DUF4838 domain-containing protein [Verrucomicrobiota bacterium]